MISSNAGLEPNCTLIGSQSRLTYTDTVSMTIVTGKVAKAFREEEGSESRVEVR